MPVRPVLCRVLGIPQDSPASNPSFDGYKENDPSTREFITEHLPTKSGVTSYIRSLFPFWNWIFHYNFTWLFGDLVAGTTVGFVVVPQGMAYALLAKLSPEYGLYTSFVGFLLYWAFATSKDITIGTVAVMSTIVSNIVTRVQADYPDIEPADIARALSVIAGCILLFLGLIRAGFIVEIIPLVAISSFMTGAAIGIAVGQLPTLLAISGVDKRAATYKVLIDTLKGLPGTKIDAAMGLTALAGLYLIRSVCTRLGKRYPAQTKIWFFVSTLRMAFIILLFTMVSWLVNRHEPNPKKALFKILGTVPSGFQVVGAPKINKRLLHALAPDLPATIIVLIIEHISIAKSFGRINNYVINPSQELVAVGFTNVLGPFLGGYPTTGSFSRTAIKAKAGVRTPLAGIFTAAVVLLALYALTSVFFYIPMSSLAALIIHAVGDLITPPKTVYQFWRTSPAEFFVFFAGVFVTIFSSIENGIYTTIGISAALLLFRVARTEGHMLGRVKTYRIARDDVVSKAELSRLVANKPQKDAYLPRKRGAFNPEMGIDSYPGILVYKFTDGFNYLNAALHFDRLVAEALKQTRPTVINKHEKSGDRPWNDPGPRRGHPSLLSDIDDPRPTLQAVVLDLAAVDHVDVTSVQALVDTRTRLAMHAAPNIVEWHFAGVTNRWTRRALAASGFGFGGNEETGAGFVVDVTALNEQQHGNASGDVEKGVESACSGNTEHRFVPVLGLNNPFFHLTVAAAMENAVRRAERSSD